MTRVLIADDHPIVRHGVRRMLEAESDLAVTGEAGTCAEALERALRDDCDFVLLDLNMPGRGGLDVLQELKRQRPDLPVLILSMYDEVQFAVRAIKAGAAGYLTKDSAGDELVRAIRHIVGGRRYVSGTLAEPLAAYLADGGRGIRDRLSERESRVLALLVDGQTVTKIADELALSVKTVSTYRTRLLRKLHVDSTAALVRYALEHQIASRCT